MVLARVLSRNTTRSQVLPPQVSLLSSLRVLAPAGGFSSPKSIFKSWKKLGHDHDHGQKRDIFHLLEKRLREHFNSKKVVLTGGGKEALLQLFLTVKKRSEKSIVIMGAYTCPDIAAAAVRAGFRIYALDLKKDSLEMDVSLLSEEIMKQTCAVVLSNLYGLIDSLPLWLEYKKKYDFFLIDDACQGAFSKDGEHFVGARQETVGVVSFGRGKAICSVGGGAVICSDQQLELFEERYSFITKKRSLCGFRDLFKGILFWVFEKPVLYFFPAHLSFLGLGGAIYQERFSEKTMNTYQALSALTQLEEKSERQAIFLEHTKKWASLLRDLPVRQPYTKHLDTQKAVLIRYPIIFQSAAKREAAWNKLEKKGLGVSQSYPQALSSYAELQPHLISTHTPVAEEIASTILTLPVHRYVQMSDMEEIVQVLKEC